MLLNTTRVAVKNFPPKNFIYIYIYIYYVGYQMSLLLLLADPGTRWARTVEPWVVGPSSDPLDLVERIILIVELADEL